MTFWANLSKTKRDKIGGSLKDIIKDFMNNQSDNNLNKVVDLSSLSFFSSDPYLNFIYKKSERLCMAVYLITDFFPEGDSIKDSMRKSSTELLKVSLSLITASSSFRKDILNDITKLSLELVSLSKVASRLGMSSLANHDVLEGEINNFISVIEDREKPSTTGQGFVLNEDMITGFASEKVRDKMVEKENKSSGISLNTNNVDANIKADASANAGVDIKAGSDVNAGTDIRAGAKKVSLGSVNPSANSQANSQVNSSVPQKNDRQQMILEIIREVGETSIKDISDNVKGCSEKTIQRELNTLIYDGVLKKVGERRWSKYILA